MHHDSGPVQPGLLAVKEAARALTVSQRTIWRLIAEGELQVVHIGRSVRITAKSVQAFIEKGGSR